MTVGSGCLRRWDSRDLDHITVAMCSDRALPTVSRAVFKVHLGNLGSSPLHNKGHDRTLSCLKHQSHHGSWGAIHDDDHRKFDRGDWS